MIFNRESNPYRNLIPIFSFSGGGLNDGYQILENSGTNWKIKFLKSGDLTLSSNHRIDIFCVGGGGAGGCQEYNPTYGYFCGGAGGGGGYTSTTKDVRAMAGSYRVEVGGGGAPTTYHGGDGGTSYISKSGNAIAAAGGGQGGRGVVKENNLYIGYGGRGGSGGGGTSADSSGNGGSNGSDGQHNVAWGSGQGSTTTEFGEGGTLYSGGGGAGHKNTGHPGGSGGGGRGAIAWGEGTNAAVSGTPNTGGGGGGGSGPTPNAAYGGSGCVIIRNHR